MARNSCNDIKCLLPQNCNRRIVITLKVKEVNRILYCSSVCSGKMLEYLFNTSRTKPLFSIQKFHGLLTEGIATNGVEITALSSIPVTRTGHRRIWWNAATEYQHNVKFIYPAFINLPYIRNLCTFLFTFFNVLFWCLKAEIIL